MFTTEDTGITDIEQIHEQALQNGARSYEDPSTGFTVFTEKFHLERGTCCGNQCRHCPYGWQNVAREHALRPAKLQSGDKEAALKLLEEIDAKKEQAQQKPSQGRFKKRVGGTSGGRLTDKNVPYTKKGDSGTSQLLTGERRKKNDLAFEAMGTVDELCTVVGVAHAMLLEASKQNEQLHGEPIDFGELPEWLLQVMSRLFDAGSHIAKPVKLREDEESSEDEETAREKFKADGVGGGMDIQHVEALEDWIDTMTELLPECKSFLLPSGSVASAQLHVCRTICRRAERTVIPLVEKGVCDPNVMSYLNRLSDFLFVASRWGNFCQGAPEIEYRRPEKRDKQRVATAKGWNGSGEKRLY
jgi:cob(I)alamin adenosyltransferase